MPDLDDPLPCAECCVENPGDIGCICVDPENGTEEEDIFLLCCVINGRLSARLGFAI